VKGVIAIGVFVALAVPTAALAETRIYSNAGSGSYYTKLVVSFGQNAIKIGLPLPSG
jgi:hypothetical protein